MAHAGAYDILFEPVRIGPVTAPNRFYQVPHCSGMGFAMPNSSIAMREMKAEGGWGVVCTEYCSTEPTSDNHPHPFCTIWDDDDQFALSRMTEAVHRHGALAGVELWSAGYSSRNNLTRTVPIGAMSMPTRYAPRQTRAMDKSDIAAFRRNHRAAAIRARDSGFDIVYVYASHGNMPLQFLSPVQNQRVDEYGGSFENRARLIRELLEDTHDAIGDRCAVALRLAVTTLDADIGVTHDGDGRALVEYLAELPDLWDVNVGGYPTDACTARFAQEGAQEDYVDFVKTVTSKPVVTVGRYTSPDRMVARIRNGKADFIGAARPSIADPFLPRKIAEGRLDDIRECIGCNICVMSDAQGVPIRCTQNPTMGEEWRRGWHPEHIDPRPVPAAPSLQGLDDPRDLLIVGAGPAGLEAARAAGERGFGVTLAEASHELGGRVLREARLAGLSTFKRVTDWRIGQLHKLPNVQIYPDSRLSAEQILDYGFRHVCIATGSTWRRNGVGRSNFRPFVGWQHDTVYTPDDVIFGRVKAKRVVVYDDDHFYLGSALAETLAQQGCEVIYATTADIVAPMCQFTLDQPRIHRRLLSLSVSIETSVSLTSFDGATARMNGNIMGRETLISCDALVVVTSREPDVRLYEALNQHDVQQVAGIAALSKIGDCDAPGLIAHAIYAGHEFSRELDGKKLPRRDGRLTEAISPIGNLSSSESRKMNDGTI